MCCLSKPNVASSEAKQDPQVVAYFIYPVNRLNLLVGVCLNYTYTKSYDLRTGYVTVVRACTFFLCVFFQSFRSKKTDGEVHINFKYRNLAQEDAPEQWLRWLNHIWQRFFGASWASGAAGASWGSLVLAAAATRPVMCNAVFTLFY